MNRKTGSIFILLLLGLNFLAACTPAPIPSPTLPATETVMSTPTQTATATPTPIPTSTPTPLPLNGQQTQYFVEATIDYYNRFITASSRAVYTNKTGTPIENLLFIVYPTIFEDSIYVKSLQWGDGSAINNYQWERHRMIIPLDSPLLPGEQIEVEHDFELYMPDRGGVFSHSGKQLNLSYWFPFIPPYDEQEGWLAHDVQIVNSSFIGEFTVFESSDFDVTISFTDRRENFKIAAPARPDENNGVIHYDLDLARTFSLSISDQFVVYERQAGDTTIQSYALDEHSNVGSVVAEVAEQALLLYTDLYGPYDRDLMTVVEFNSDIGMEFDGLIFLSPAFYNLYPGTPKSNIHVYTAHEIAHQWFFSQVGNDQALEPWLDEAFATYSERLFYEHFYPEHVNWHWENYVTSHNPSGDIDITIYFGGGLGEYRDIVYRNGALFLHDLRNLLGDDVFFNCIRDYIQQNRYEIANGEDFWSLLREHTDADLIPITEEYFSKIPASLE